MLWQRVQILATKYNIINCVPEDYGDIAIEHSHKTAKIIYKIYDSDFIFGESMSKLPLKFLLSFSTIMIHEIAISFKRRN